MNIKITAFLLSLAFVGSASSQVTTESLAKEGIKPLTQTELEQLVIGNTVRHKRLNSNLEVDIFYRNDNTRVYWTLGANKGARFEGWYKIRDGKRCELSSRGGELCFTMYPQMKNKYLICDTSEKCEWEATVDKGNPDQIQ